MINLINNIFIYLKFYHKIQKNKKIYKKKDISSSDFFKNELNIIK